MRNRGFAGDTDHEARLRAALEAVLIDLGHLDLRTDRDSRLRLVVSEYKNETGANALDELRAIIRRAEDRVKAATE